MSSNLSDLSDRELLSNTDRVARGLRRGGVVLLHHLNEIEHRGVFLKFGYGSLFAYCTESLRLSESAAGRYVAVARCLRRFPEIATLLESGEANLMTVSLVAGILTPENKKTVLLRLRGASKRAVEAMVSGYRPLPAVRDRVRPVTVRVPVTATVPPMKPAMALRGGADGKGRRETHGSAASVDGGLFRAPTGGSGLSTTQGRGPSGQCGLTPDTPSEPVMRLTRQNKFEFVAGDEFMKAFEKMRALLGSHAHGQPSFEDVFLAGMDTWLDKHDPARRHARREARRAALQPVCKGEASASPEGCGRDGRRAAPNRVVRARVARRPSQERALQRERIARTSEPGVACNPLSGGSRSSRTQGARPEGHARPKNRSRSSCAAATQKGSQKVAASASRHIPAAVRDAVVARHDNRCSYVAPSGHRCSATRHLQIDHVTPFARGGRHEAGNLRLLCAKHNRLEAERLLGRDVMARHRRG